MTKKILKITGVANVVADPAVHATVRELVKVMDNEMFPGNAFASRCMGCSSIVS